MLFYYYGSLDEALQAVYPEYVPKEKPQKDKDSSTQLASERVKAERKQRKYWQNMDNQRAFLTKAGQALGVKDVCVDIHIILFPS